MKRLPAVFLTLALTGCSRLGVRLGGEGGASRPDAAAPAPAIREAPPASVAQAKEEEAIRTALRLLADKRAAFTIGPADLLEVSVYQEPDLERKARVSADGTVTVPLIGELKLGGLTVAQAEQAIQQKLKRYLIDPHVSVFVREYGNKQIYVFGEVQKPGSYALPTEAPLTVLEAVVLAGGFTQYAAADRTRVIRTREGQNETFVVEVSAITKHGDKSKDVRLEPNDVVFVPESFF